MENEVSGACMLLRTGMVQLPVAPPYAWVQQAGSTTGQRMHRSTHLRHAAVQAPPTVKLGADSVCRTCRQDKRCRAGACRYSIRTVELNLGYTLLELACRPACLPAGRPAHPPTSNRRTSTQRSRLSLAQVSTRPPLQGGVGLGTELEGRGSGRSMGVSVPTEPLSTNECH